MPGVGSEEVSGTATVAPPPGAQHRELGNGVKRGPKSGHTGDQVPVASPFPVPNPPVLFCPVAPWLPLTGSGHGLFSQPGLPSAFVSPVLRAAPNVLSESLAFQMLFDLDAVLSQWREAVGTSKV